MKRERSKEGDVNSPGVPLAKCFCRTGLKIEVKAESVTSSDAVSHHVPTTVPTHVT
jgi:hypothetical protein